MSGGESAAEMLSGTLGAVRDAMTAVENALQVDITADTWDEAMIPACDLCEAADALCERVRDEYRKSEDEPDEPFPTNGSGAGETARSPDHEPTGGT